MRGGVIAVFLMVLGAGAVIVGVGVIGASVVARDRVEAAVRGSIGVIGHAEDGLSEMERSVGEASAMLPQISNALGQAARITGAASGVLGETREAAVEMVESLRLLARDLDGMAGQLGLLGRSGQMRETAKQIRVSATQLEQANVEMARLRTQVDALAPIMTEVSTQVAALDTRLVPSRDALPDLRGRLARTRAGIDPGTVTDGLLIGARIAGGLCLLLGLALWGIGSTRRQLARAAEA